jgi:DNA-binding beta-propeller fold protein YncE
MPWAPASAAPRAPTIDSSRQLTDTRLPCGREVVTMAAMRTCAVTLLVIALVLATNGTARADFLFVTEWGSAGPGAGQFSAPLGVASTGAGSVYVTDASANRVQRFNSDGAFVTAFGSAGAGPGQFTRAGHVAADAFGSVYVTDPGSARVQRFTADGVFVLAWGTPGLGDGQFLSPAGIALDSLGNVYVADSQANRVQRFTPEGAFDLAWGATGGGPGQFSSAQDVAVDVFGDVYVVDGVANRVQKFTRDGALLFGWGSGGAGEGQFDAPAGISTDGAGNVYVADTGNQRVQVFNGDGAFLEQFGGPGAGPGQFSAPVDVASDSSAAVYVADQGNARVQKFAEPTPPLPPATAGATANIESVSGAVLVRRPGAPGFVRLRRAEQVPVGSLVQATRGVVRLTTASNLRGGQQTARFYDGRFRISQRRTRFPVTQLVLAGGDFGVCRRAGVQAGARAAATRRKRSRRRVRRLWGDGDGRFRVDGRYGSAGARGTIWLTEDRCDGTLVRVREGLVEVRDFARRRTVRVTAGQSYLVRAP